MKRFCLLALLTFYSIVIYEIAKESKEIFAQGFVNNNPFVTLRTLKELGK